ncbi:NAD(P)H-dependent oxidoreductase [Caldibacillus lycopersici]|uniref:NAD(P)H-dependent oxidoreductase n=1 Tax=Perspicuibacillus lycopersici TaxID=1325689 RepID=A0AAE3LPV6_9BACI|nr:NAD(P)H-dependent oxidoreductase [Perspicuibacillus lycopersici]MCU9615327.1 NAD(P)H-dependent oxidoreductase [Perspicuibacillus lycopersici]
MKIVGVSGTLAGGKTSQMVYDVLHAAKLVDTSVETELMDIKDYDIEFMRGVPLSYYNDETVEVVNKILNADCIVIGTPVYQASIAGALKNLLDLMPEHAFRNKVVGYISTAGSEKHFLVAEYNLRPILQFLGATVPSRNVFVPDDHFDEENVIVDKWTKDRIQKMAKEMVQLTKSVKDF